jgi:transposase
MIFKDLFVRLLEEGFKAVIIDRGMSSEENIKKVLQARMRLICGVKKSSGLRERFLTKIKREALYRVEKRVKLQNTSVYIQEFPYQKGKMIVVYNPSLEVVKREIVYEENGTDEEARDVGYSFIFHNTDLLAAEVTRKYFEKEIVDRAFKKIKGALSLRPIRVWKKEHIEGHLRICYLAYAILSFLEYFVKKFDLTATEFLEKLKRGYRVYLKDLKSDYMWQTDVHLEKRLQRIIDSLSASL